MTYQNKTIGLILEQRLCVAYSGNLSLKAIVHKSSKNIASVWLISFKNKYFDYKDSLYRLQYWDVLACSNDHYTLSRIIFKFNGAPD